METYSVKHWLWQGRLLLKNHKPNRHPVYSLNERDRATAEDETNGLINILPGNHADVHCCQPTHGSSQKPGIYCYGPLLHEAQISSVFGDSKNFVDMKTKFDANEILRKFRTVGKEIISMNRAKKLAKLTEFIKENLSPVSTDADFIKWTPVDWSESPDFLAKVKDEKLRVWGAKLNQLWKSLGRKIADEVSQSPNNHSIIYCSNPFIIPGGRFREFYYWDNYWINRGLLLCEMYETVKGTIRNFFEMVDAYGFIPNGGRIYYTRRSQPPFLSLMVQDYVRFSGDENFIREALPFLEKEYRFWETQRAVQLTDSDGSVHRLTRYASDVNQPRPESYKEDYELIHKHDLGKEAKLELMTHITSACESGWDFSSRWTGGQYDGAEGQALLLQLTTRDIIPVDLNGILCAVESILAGFNDHAGNLVQSEVFRQKYANRVEAMERFLWNEQDGTYYDYVMSKQTQNKQFFASNLTPLWTKSYPASVDAGSRDAAMYKYLKSQEYEGTKLLDFPGGIPVSLNNTGQQWDFPNAWAPLSHMLIEGMQDSDVIELKDEAFRQAQKYVKSCWNGFTNPNYEDAMFEKYNVLTDDGVPGNGGEYDVQEGFGWTNGVAICLLDAFGDRLEAQGVNRNTES